MSTDYDELSSEGFDEFGDPIYGDHKGFSQQNEFPTSEDELRGMTHMDEASRFNHSQRLQATTAGNLFGLNMELYKSSEKGQNVRKTHQIRANNPPPISRNTYNKAYSKKQKLDLAWEKFSSLDQYLQDEVELEYRLICSQLEQ